MHLSSFSKETSFLIGMLQGASELTNSYFRSAPKLREKGNNQGIVTEADENCEAFLKRSILQTFPDHTFLGEESGTSSGELISKNASNLLWIVDPIDGTTNFANGNSYHCISIAFGQTNKGVFEPISAGIARPFYNEVFVAERGKGSYQLIETGIKTFLSPLHVSKTTELRNASVASGFSSHSGHALETLSAQFGKIHSKCRGLRINGAAALDLAHCANGTVSAFFEAKLNSWDMAAGALLVQESGGINVNYEGEPFNCLADENIISGPKELVDQLLKLIRD
jgi:myo-inositol-1(or 4)-monophosphatase